MLVLFFPKGNDCAVHLTWELLGARQAETDSRLKVDGFHPNLNAFLHAQGFRGPTEKQVVFAHGTENGSGIEVRTTTIPSAWWGCPPSFKLGLFYACFGSKTLSNAYQSLFDDWISYTDDLSMVVGDPAHTHLIRGFWKTVFLRLLAAFETSQDSAEAKRAFQGVYKTSLAELDKIPKGSFGELTKVHILQALNSLCVKT